jgi:lipopolysaccharide transport system ATP-binding protein
MADSIITVENLSKRYLVGHQSAQRDRVTTFREMITREARNFIRKADDLVHGRQIVQGDSIEEFWALRNVSFEVRKGEVVGIIGRNGAGKSTLLKILSRITEPTEGRVLLRGRVASLLEVGTGFHPELTGRENIFLNGAVLGMTQREIKNKFDEIVAFADVAQFLDTPVKHYSSGMYVRLAFAVAAHLEPEILIVDEVLAVGDAEFQKKCLNKMNDVARSGRTVLFVSHNMNAVERLCARVIYLKNGHLVDSYNNVRKGRLAYISGVDGGPANTRWVNSGSEYRNEYFVPQRLEVFNSNTPEQPGPIFSNNHPIQVVVSGHVLRSDPALNVGIAVYDENDQLMFWSLSSDMREKYWPRLDLGQVILRAAIPSHFLNEGSYRMELIASLHYRAWILEPQTKVPQVRFSIQGGLSNSPYWDEKRPGVLAPILNWQRPSSSDFPKLEPPRAEGGDVRPMPSC